MLKKELLAQQALKNQNKKYKKGIINHADEEQELDKKMIKKRNSCLKKKYDKLGLSEKAIKYRQY